MSEIESALNGILKDLLHYTKLMSIKAKMCREYYECLIEEGFTKEEALELCKFFKMGEA